VKITSGDKFVMQATIRFGYVLAYASSLTWPKTGRTFHAGDGDGKWQMG